MHTLIFDEELTPKKYLRLLLQSYPYDIEEAMVYTLLSKTTYPHPVLLSFLTYVQGIQKYRICTTCSPIPSALTRLFHKMSALSQKSASVLHTHHYAFHATFILQHHPFSHPYAHLPFNKISFLDTIHVHSIPLFHMPSILQEVPIVKQTTFIYRDISMDATCFFALSIQIVDKQGIIFLPKDCLALAICIASMYALCTPSIHQDFLLIFGLLDTTNTREYYYDETNKLYIALVRGDRSMHHFQYVKDMVLTLYNCICLSKHDLPLHASMLEIAIHDRTYGIVFAGETGSGKSELLLAFSQLCQSHHLACTPLYDDHGTLHYLDNEIVSTGGELSRYTTLATMKPQDIFATFSASIFLQEDTGSLYQITPLSTHKQSLAFHKVTHMFYLNTTTRKKGFQRIATLQECQEVFLNGWYTMRNGSIASSFFFNALGPAQQQLQTTQLVHDFLTILYVQDIPIYTLYTHGTKHQKESVFKSLATRILKEILV